VLERGADLEMSRRTQESPQSNAGNWMMRLSFSPLEQLDLGDHLGDQIGTLEVSRKKAPKVSQAHRAVHDSKSI